MNKKKKKFKQIKKKTQCFFNETRHRNGIVNRKVLSNNFDKLLFLEVQGKRII